MIRSAASTPASPIRCLQTRFGQVTPRHQDVIDNVISRFPCLRHGADRCTRRFVDEARIRQVIHDSMTQLLLHDPAGLRYQFSDNDDAKRYFRERIFPICCPSAFFRRALEKPNGYAGDYLVMDMMYRMCSLPNPSSGPLARIVNDWFLNTPSAVANRERQRYLIRVIDRSVRAGARRIACLASGPAREIATYLEQRSGQYPPLEFVLVDNDREALDYSRQQLSCFRKSGGVRFDFVEGNPMRLALGKSLGVRTEFDLVYSAGLIDYLSDRAVGRLLTTIHGWLRPGGDVVLGQFIERSDSKIRFGLEWGLDWHLRYRTRSELLRVFDASPFKSNVHIKDQQSAIIMFARATKAKCRLPSITNCNIEDNAVTILAGEVPTPAAVVNGTYVEGYNKYRRNGKTTKRSQS